MARFPETVIMLIITPVWPVCYTCYVYVLMSYSVYMLPALFRTRNKLSFKKLIFFLKLFKMQNFLKKNSIRKDSVLLSVKTRSWIFISDHNNDTLNVKFLKEWGKKVIFSGNKLDFLFKKVKKISKIIYRHYSHL